MSIWLAVFRAELIRALPFLPWVAGLHALMLYIRCSWGFAISPRLTGIIEWSTWLLAAVILVPSVRADSPFRRERFLATRPASPWVLFPAKFAGLLVAVALPFVLVEFISLAIWGEPVRILVLGTLQPAIFGFVVVAAAIPLLWYWSGRTASVFGLLLVLLSALGTVILVNMVQERRYERSWILQDDFPRVLSLLLAIAFTGLLLGLLLIALPKFPRRNRNTAKGMLVIPAAGIAVFAAGWVASRPPAVDRGEPAPLVVVTYGVEDFGTRHRHTLNVLPPFPAPDPGEEVSRVFTKLEVGGKNVRPPIERGVISSGEESFVSRNSVQEALRRRFGESLTLPPAERQRGGSPAWVNFFKSGKKTDERPSLDLAVQETRYRWEVVGEMPMSPGASFKHGGNHWRLEASAMPDREETLGEQMLLRWKYPAIWLGGAPTEWFYRTDYRLAAVNGEGFVFNVNASGRSEKSVARSALREYGMFLYLSRPYDPNRKTDEPVIDLSRGPWPEDTRLVILHRIPICRETYTWASPPVIPASGAIPPEKGNLPEWLRWTRLGLGSSFNGVDTILAAPEETGYSEDKWLAFFRLFPSAQAYRVLRDKFLPAEVIDRETDRFIALYSPEDTYLWEVNPPPELALARGHAEAPAWYHRWISQWDAKRYIIDTGEAAGAIRLAFTPPPSAGSDDAVIAWFLVQDPGRFVFDPATGKYQTR